MSNNCVFRYDASSEDLIDVIEGNRVYIPCIYVLNKVSEFLFGKFSELKLTNRSKLIP